MKMRISLTKLIMLVLIYIPAANSNTEEVLTYSCKLIQPNKTTHSLKLISSNYEIKKINYISMNYKGNDCNIGATHNDGESIWDFNDNIINIIIKHPDQPENIVSEIEIIKNKENYKINFNYIDYQFSCSPLMNEIAKTVEILNGSDTCIITQ